MYLDSFWCYQPDGTEPEIGDLPLLTNGYVSFGCLNNFCKVNEPMLELWARVMREVTHSRLLILAKEGSHRQRTKEFLTQQGVAQERVEFAGMRARREYLELYRGIDVVLDTFPYNGHTTSLDALYMGVPVVSLYGETPVSRAGLSQLSNLGLPELVTPDKEEFVRIAVELARDTERLKALRVTLRERMQGSAIMDAEKWTRQIEAAFREMWRRWCARGQG